MTHDTQTREALVEVMRSGAIAAGKSEPSWADCITDAEWEGAITALEAAGVRLVPAEPTHDQMTHAMLHRSVAERPPHIYDTAGTYRVMLAASPYAKEPTND